MNSLLFCRNRCLRYQLSSVCPLTKSFKNALVSNFRTYNNPYPSEKDESLMSLSFRPTTLRQFSSSAIVQCFEKQLESEKKTFAQRMLNRIYSVGDTKLKATGYFLLSNCTLKVDVEKFFATFSMPDTFYSWFLVTELHVWMLAVRLMEEGKEGRVVRNYMIEALWQDCEARAKMIGDQSAASRSKDIISMSEELGVKKGYFKILFILF